MPASNPKSSPVGPDHGAPLMHGRLLNPVGPSALASVPASDELDGAGSGGGLPPPHSMSAWTGRDQSDNDTTPSENTTSRSALSKFLMNGKG